MPQARHWNRTEYYRDSEDMNCCTGHNELGFSLAGGADLENKVITVSGPVMGFIRARGNDPWRGEHLSGGESEECIASGFSLGPQGRFNIWELML